MTSPAHSVIGGARTSNAASLTQTLFTHYITLCVNVTEKDTNVISRSFVQEVPRENNVSSVLVYTLYDTLSFLQSVSRVGTLLLSDVTMH